MLIGALKRTGLIAAVLALLLGGAASAAFAQDETTFSTPDAARLQALSSDGTMIATTTNGGREICVFTVPNGEQVSCADLSESQIRIDPETITWSPDGSELVFAESIALYLVDGDIWRFEITSGELTNLTDDGINDSLPFGDEALDPPFLLDFAPAWSPDGSMIAFTRTVLAGGDAPSSTSMMLLDTATGEVAELALFEEETPMALPFRIAWAPSGEVIFASAWLGDADNERNGIWAFDVGNGDFAQLAGPAPEFDGASPVVLAVSPAGGMLVVSYPAYIQGETSVSKRSGYALLDVANGALEPIEPGEEHAGNFSAVVGPVFSPDGRALVFGVRQPSQEAGFIVARDLESGDDLVLAELPDGEFPRISGVMSSVQVGGSTVLVLINPTTGVIAELPADLTDAVASGSALATPETEIDSVALVVTVAERAAVLREGPSGDDDIIAIVQPGTTMTAVGNPFESDDHFWIEVTVDETGETGFVRTDFLEPVG